MTMTADFMKDAEYVELCGSRTVLKVASTLISVFDKYNTEDYASSLKAKAVGRVIDLNSLKANIARLQPVLDESRQLQGYFWKTALYLQEKELAAQKHMEWLKRQEKEQESLRVLYKAFIRRPTLPKEITDTVLNHISTDNKLIFWGPDRPDVYVYVDGLLTLAVYNPFLLLPHYKRIFSTEWTLENIAEQEMDWSVLEDTSLIDHINLRMRVKRTDDFSFLRPLMKHPHQWKNLSFESRFDMGGFVDVFRPCLPHLEKIRVKTNFVASPGVVLPPGSCRKLKTADLSFNAFLEFFNSRVLSSITRLTLYRIDSSQFPYHDVFKEALNNFPLAISHLSRLRELIIQNTDWDYYDMEDLQKVHSTSLRSLEVSECSNETAIVFLNLFANCTLDRIDVHADLLEEVGRLFGGVRRVGFLEYVPDILFRRKQDGSLAFSRMEYMELSYIGHPLEDGILQLQNDILQAVRMRYEDPIVCRIGHLRIPKKVVTSRQFQDELERYVPSLVLY